MCPNPISFRRGGGSPAKNLPPPGTDRVACREAERGEDVHALRKFGTIRPEGSVKLVARSLWPDVSGQARRPRCTSTKFPGVRASCRSRDHPRYRLQTRIQGVRESGPVACRRPRDSLLVRRLRPRLAQPWLAFVQTFGDLTKESNLQREQEPSTCRPAYCLCDADLGIRAVHLP